MTGEITLSGLVLPVGGIREKALAARRQGIKTFILPDQNKADAPELPEELRRDMTFVPARTLMDVLDTALPRVRRPRRARPHDPTPCQPSRPWRAQHRNRDSPQSPPGRRPWSSTCRATASVTPPASSRSSTR